MLAELPFSWCGCAASQAQVASAFGVDPATVWRWDQALAAGGVAGLAPARKGPRRASKLTGEIVRGSPGLDVAGKSLHQNAAATGVFTFSVRNALGRIPPRAAGPGAADEDAVGGDDDAGREAAGESAPGEHDRAGAGQREPLPVLPDPVPRGGERAAARWGPLGEGAEPVFRPGARYPLAGLLLALPALEDTGLLACARGEYGRLKNGFCGLAATLLTLVFLALAGEPRAEGATRVPSAALGRVLGLDRAPEVKTIRRKLADLASAGKAADLFMALARHHATTPPPGRKRWGSSTWMGTPAPTTAPAACTRRTWPGPPSGSGPPLPPTRSRAIRATTGLGSTHAARSGNRRQAHSLRPCMPPGPARRCAHRVPPGGTLPRLHETRPWPPSPATLTE